MDKRRKLLIHGINKLVDEGLISLTPTGIDRGDERDDGYLRTELLGRPSMISWSDIGFEELRISVWWNYDHDRHPQANLQGSFQEKFKTSLPLAKSQEFPKFVGATVSGWLERKNGPHLQGKGGENIFDVYIRRGEREVLEGLPVPEAHGFKAEGKFYF